MNLNPSSSFGGDFIPDISDVELINSTLGGAMDKNLVYLNSELYMIKFDKEGSTKCYSEFIASKLANKLSIECQTCSLAIYKGSVVSLIKLFTTGGSSIHCYYDFNDSSIEDLSKDVRDLPYSFDYIIFVLSNYKNCNIAVKERLNNFITMCLFDCIIGNFDRHWGNWGYLGHGKDYKICPLYDNGSSLLSKISDEESIKILNNKNEILRYVFDIPKSQIRKNNSKPIRYEDLINLLIELPNSEECISLFIKKFINCDLDGIFNDEKLITGLGKNKCRLLNLLINLRFKLLIENKYLSGFGGIV